MATNLIDTGCTECFEAVLPRCPETITIDSDFTPDETLTLEIEDLYGNKYRIESEAVYAGSALFLTETLPEGLLWSGVFTFRMFSDSPYGYCEDERLICGDYYCVTVTFQNVIKESRICCDDAIIPPDPDAPATDCPCGIEEITVHTDETLNLDLTDETIEKYYITFQAGGTINFPQISSLPASRRGIEITITFQSTAIVLGNPAVTDRLGILPIGTQGIGNVVAGQSAWIRIGTATIWSIND